MSISYPNLKKNKHNIKIVYATIHMFVALLGMESKWLDIFGSLLPIREFCVTNFFKISKNPFESNYFWTITEITGSFAFQSSYVLIQMDNVQEHNIQRS